MCISTYLLNVFWLIKWLWAYQALMNHEIAICGREIVDIDTWKSYNNSYLSVNKIPMFP